MRRKSYIFVDGVESNQEHPKTFEIPSRSERENVAVGTFVKLLFEAREVVADGQWGGERMWVKVTARNAGGSYSGTLSNTPVVFTDIKSGDAVSFEAKHIIDIRDEGEEEDCGGTCIACVRREAWIDGWLYANPDADVEDAEVAFDDFIDTLDDEAVS